MQLIVLCESRPLRSLQEFEASTHNELLPQAIRDTATSLNIQLNPLFGPHPGRIVQTPVLRAQLLQTFQTRLQSKASIHLDLDNPIERLSSYYCVTGAQDLRAAHAALLGQPGIAACYLTPTPQLPIAPKPQLFSTTATPPVVTPDFSPQQGYLGVAPGGLSPDAAWALPGGSGQGIRLIDIETEWRFTHECLTSDFGGVFGGEPTTDLDSENHGTAVLGILCGRKAASGVKGIAAYCDIRGYSAFDGQNYLPSAAIQASAEVLSPGDIILIEQHAPGPRYNYADCSDQRGYIAIEWWPDVYDAIAYATAKGIIVVEAAGNGSENLDDPLYDSRPNDFPASWVNPFRRNPNDCGAIMVGAGAPPNGQFGVDRSRLYFSNYGSCLDVQGWGLSVTTTGYGDLYGGNSRDTWYTAQFGGTSSASPMVAASAACLQGIRKARVAAPISPSEMRKLFRTTGSAQQADPSAPVNQNIGSRPNLTALVAHI